MVVFFVLFRFIFSAFFWRSVAYACTFWPKRKGHRNHADGVGCTKYSEGKHRRPRWRTDWAAAAACQPTRERRKEKTCKTISFSCSHLHLVPSPTYRFTAFRIHSVRKYRARMDTHAKAPAHPIFPNREVYVQNSTFTKTGGNLAGKILVCCPPKIETGTSD